MLVALVQLRVGTSSIAAGMSSLFRFRKSDLIRISWRNTTWCMGSVGGLVTIAVSSCSFRVRRACEGRVGLPATFRTLPLVKCK